MIQSNQKLASKLEERYLLLVLQTYVEHNTMMTPDKNVHYDHIGYLLSAYRMLLLRGSITVFNVTRHSVSKATAGKSNHRNQSCTL